MTMENKNVREYTRTIVTVRYESGMRAVALVKDLEDGNFFPSLYPRSVPDSVTIVEKTITQWKPTR